MTTEFIMFGGKGGVGKTTCASATALSLAKDGHKTLVVSTDPAHSIADVFDVEIGSKPTPIDDEYELYAVEVDPEERFNENYSSTAKALINEAGRFGIDIDTSEFSDMDGGVIGSDEAAVIDLFAEYDENQEWDYVVFDTAPTGHTLRMLKLPEILDSTVGTLLNVKTQVDSIKTKVSSIWPRNDEVDENEPKLEDVDIDETRNKLQRVSELLTDPSRTQFFAVMEAEELSLFETKRLLNQLNTYEIPVGGVFVNKVLQEVNEDCDLCSSRRDSQQSILEEANNSMDVPLLQIPLQGEPPRGDDLHSIADRISVS